MPDQRAFPIVRIDTQVNAVMTFVGILSNTSLVVILQVILSSSNTILNWFQALHKRGKAINSQSMIAVVKYT